MRLTRAWATNEKGKAIEYVAIPVDDTKVQFDVWQKLGQLEDIEEELEVDLIIWLKSILNGFYLKDNLGKIVFIQNTTPAITALNAVKEFYKDYGKTWALTKEELE